MSQNKLCAHCGEMVSKYDEDHACPLNNRTIKSTVESVLKLRQQDEAFAKAKADKETQERLRNLRLWHWSMVSYHRSTAVDMRRREDRMGGVYHDAQANFHLKAVQTLNDFFPVGDTAEQDARK